MEKELLTVGELAKVMNVTVRTLQYYDKENVLKPTAKSEGGRRLYTKKDMVKLHQILSLKFLGFSLEEIKEQLFTLDTPAEVVDVLDRQTQLVREQIASLQQALKALEALKEEVIYIDKVDFDKYADIIAILRQNNEHYGLIKLFDEKLLNHVKDKYIAAPTQADDLLERYTQLCREVKELIGKGILPESKEGMEFAEAFWQMVMEFTGGDMSLLPNLIKLKEKKLPPHQEEGAWQEEMDVFIGNALNHYLGQKGMKLF